MRIIEREANSQVNIIKKSYKRRKPWTHVLYIKNANLYLPELLAVDSKAGPEVKGISKIFDEFKVPNKSKVLDFSCGIGRHSIRLSKIGYHVVGYDPSHLFIKKAKQNLKHENGNLQIKFYSGDPFQAAKILSSKKEVGFKAIVIMYNSIGYATPREDIRIFKDLLSLSSNDGTVLITQTENRDWRIRNFQPCIVSDYDKMEIHERWKFNLEDSVFDGVLKFYKKKYCGLSLIQELPVRLRLYSLHELKQLLHDSGWNFVKSYGNIATLDPASPESSEVVTVSTNRP